jgi:hypothetical protein
VAGLALLFDEIENHIQFHLDGTARPTAVQLPGQMIFHENAFS